jgi:hypothetical protein
MVIGNCIFNKFNIVAECKSGTSVSGTTVFNGYKTPDFTKKQPEY